MIKIENERLLYCDCDDTLVQWDISKYPELEDVDVTCYGYTTPLKINRKNINLIEKFVKLGYGIVVWSQSGADWAEAVSKAIGIGQFVEGYLTKPRYIMDDMPVDAWIGENVFRDPVTGKSNRG